MTYDFINSVLFQTEDLSVKFVDRLSEKHRRVEPLEELISINQLCETDLFYSSTPKEISSPNRSSQSRSSPAPGCSYTQVPTTSTANHSLVSP